MKILLASSSSGSRGGGELYLLYLGRALAQRGHQVVLWSSDHPRMDELVGAFQEFGGVVRAPYVNTYDRKLRSIGAYFDAGTARRVADSWRQISPDVIHINKQNLEDGLDLLHAARCVDIPSVATIHLSQTARYLKAVAAPVRDAISKSALDRFSGPLVTVLDQRQRDLKDFLGESPRIRMIANGVPLYDLSQRGTKREETRRELGLSEKDRLIVAVGRLMPQKRPLTFLEQAAHAKHVPDLHFLWIGDGMLAEAWDAKVSELRLEKTVRRLAWQKQVERFLFAADVFLHVAEYEGLPLAILEAMSAALPCAISDHLLAEMPFFGPQEAVPVDADGRWLSVLDETERLKSMAVNNRSVAERQFSYDRMAAGYEELYREVLAR